MSCGQLDVVHVLASACMCACACVCKGSVWPHCAFLMSFLSLISVILYLSITC